MDPALWSRAREATAAAHHKVSAPGPRGWHFGQTRSSFSNPCLRSSGYLYTVYLSISIYYSMKTHVYIHTYINTSMYRYVSTCLHQPKATAVARWQKWPQYAPHVELSEGLKVQVSKKRIWIQRMSRRILEPGWQSCKSYTR